jgi:phosphoribulokinase
LLKFCAFALSGKLFNCMLSAVFNSFHGYIAVTFLALASNATVSQVFKKIAHMENIEETFLGDFITFNNMKNTLEDKKKNDRNRLIQQNRCLNTLKIRFKIIIK